MKLAKLKEVLQDETRNVTSSVFFDLHRCVEAYLRRLLLVALRLNGARYDNATVVVSERFIRVDDLIPLVKRLLSNAKPPARKTKNRIRKNHPDLDTLQKLFINFTSFHRNRIAHGVVDDLQGEELLAILCHVDYSFFIEFERMLHSEFGHSAFERPGAWGAARGRDESVDAVTSRLQIKCKGVIRATSTKEVLDVLENSLYAFSPTLAE